MEFDAHIPLYIQIASDIQKRIAQGQWAIGSMLPPEAELAELYSCGRATLRAAVEILASRGYLSKRRGVGTIITVPPLVYDEKTPISFTEEMMLKKKAHYTEIRSLRVMNNERIAQELALDSAENIIAIERLRYVENHPALYEISYIPEKYFQDINEDDIAKLGLYQTFARRFKIFQMAVKEQYQVKFLTLQQASLLFMETDYPAIGIIRRASSGDKLIEYTEAVTHPQYYPITVNISRG